MRTVAVPRGVVLATLFMVAALVAPAIAAPLGPPAPDPYPRIAFVARNDVPFDSLAIGPIAGSVGGVVAITNPKSLSVPAATILTEYGPDLVVIAGGVGAVSQDVEDEIEALGSWEIDRAAGKTRDETAREIARLLDEYGLGRPAQLSTSSGQNVGDLYLGGTLTTENLEVTGTNNVAPMIWSAADFLNPYPYTDGSVLPHTLEIDVPAGGGALHVTATALIQNRDEEERALVNIFGIIDGTSTDFEYEDLVLWGAVSLDRDAAYEPALRSEDDLASNETTATVQSAFPISAGPHTIRVYYSGAGGMSTDVVTILSPTVTAVWYPASSVGSVEFTPFDLS